MAAQVGPREASYCTYHFQEAAVSVCTDHNCQAKLRCTSHRPVLCEACSQSLSLILICLSDSFFRSLVFTVFPFSRSFIKRTFMKHLQFDRFQVLCYVLDHGHENLLVSASGKS